MGCFATLIRWNLFAQNPYMENASIVQWMVLIFRNFDRVIRIMVELSKDLKCLICKDLSLNYKARSSLADHYWNVHKRRTAEYFLDNVATIDPEELERKMHSE